MNTLTIKNVGPISMLDIVLNRYNVFIGKQSSGKSTIAKIISNSMWMEKEIATHPYNPTENYEFSYLDRLLGFHSMEGYVGKDSFIKYDSDFVTIVFEGGKCQITRKATINDYQRKKILYIPAERNMVVYNDSIGGSGNLRSFAADWQSARDFFDEQHQQTVLNLGVRYYKTGENGKTVNHVASASKKESYDINLKSGSSGLQSVIPITAAVDFYTDGFYAQGNQERLMKADEKYDIRKLLEYYVKTHKITNLESQNEAIINIMSEVTGLVSTSSTSFVIEEPEINLFPETQYALVNFIIERTKHKNRHHQATITTHSPYILSTLNILLLAGRLKENEKYTEQVEKITDSYVKAEELSAWSVSGGKVTDITDKKTGLISENYLDTVSDVLAGKFNELYRIYLTSLRER